MDEFEIIEQYFKKHYPHHKDTLSLGIGDDAAIIHLPEYDELLLSIDTLVSGVHFFEDASPEDVAYKAIAVNLSDIAAMCGKPRWVTLAITLPESHLDWLSRFAEGFNQVCDKYGLILIGGDITRGPLTITVQIHGTSPKGKSIRRNGANRGDQIYVSGQLGAAAYALQSLLHSDQFSAASDEEINRLHRPEPRVRLGLEIREFATSCIDISDGLFGDLGHILKASSVGAEIMLDTLPLTDSLKKLDFDKAMQMALCGGDDYELCFTLPIGINKASLDEIMSICPITCIGKIAEAEHGLMLIDKNDETYSLKDSSFRHF